MSPKLAWGLIACLVLAAVARGEEDDDLAADLKKMQGRYEINFQNAAGVQFRSVQDIGDKVSVVTTYDDVGNVVQSHTSEFKLEKQGPVRVFTFFNLTVTAGPHKGVQQPASSSYIYRLVDGHFVEVVGLLEGDSRRPHMNIWRRIKD